MNFPQTKLLEHCEFRSYHIKLNSLLLAAYRIPNAYFLPLFYDLHTVKQEKILMEWKWPVLIKRTYQKNLYAPELQIQEVILQHENCKLNYVFEIF